MLEAELDNTFGSCMDDIIAWEEPNDKTFLCIRLLASWC